MPKVYTQYTKGVVYLCNKGIAIINVFRICFIMSNRDNIPTTEPLKEIAGTTWLWKRILSDYPASTWTLTYYFLLESGTTSFTIEATADGDDHLVDVDESVTAAYTKGEYQWQAVATDGTDKCFIDAGCLEILQNYGTDTEDPRSHVQKVYDSLKAVVEGYATSSALKTKINGKEIEKMGYSDLMAAYNHFKNLANAECIKNSSTDNPGALNETRMVRHVFGRPQ